MDRKEWKDKDGKGVGMSDIYNKIKNLDLQKKHAILTSLDKESFGKKELCAGREEWKTSGIFKVDGKEVFVDIPGNEPKLVVCGAGHVSIPVIRIGEMLGFDVTVLEDRPSFAENAKNAGADHVICKPFEEALQEVKGDNDTYFVIVTRGHQYDQICMQNILTKTSAYVGMMGSKRRVGMIKENLMEKGFERAVVESLHTPIGIDIGAETPAEIAVSILAEIIKVRKESGASGAFPKEILEEILSKKEEPYVLATIISREGSAPQGPGTKMLIKQDETCVGTIGGGYMEAMVRKEAFALLGDPEEEIKICFVNLDNPKAGEEGMVCGGRLRILLEKIR